ncbi:unnamed protein product [Caenorhabditis brenneri]
MSLSKFKQFLKQFQFEDVSDESNFYEGDYIDETLSKTWRGSGRDWEISLKKEGKKRLNLKIEVSETEEDSEKHIECQYAVFLTHKNSLKMNTIKIYGRAMINEESNPIFRSYHKLSLFHKLRGVSMKDMYMLFEVDIIVFYDKDGIRNLYLGYQHDMPELPRVTINGKEICLPMRALKRRAPLLAKALEANKISEDMKNYLEVFSQVMLGVQVQLKD